MRPYLAVVRDSFHEAFVSRVLWILLALTTLFLVALLPLGIIEQAGSALRDEDFLNRDQLVENIVAQGASKQPSPGRRIWELLDDSNKQVLGRKPNDPVEKRRRFFSLVRPLQTMLARRDFYRESDWVSVKLSSAARSLHAKGLKNLPSDELARFNRLALEAAYPDEIGPIPRKQIQLAYFSWELGLPLPVEPEQLYPAMNQLLVITLGTLLGVAGVFVAVLVTASMIPQTFEAGSADLLLSKPIFRSWLFLAKFIGGCAFIAINAAYFIGGLWLIVGLRFGLWNERLLLAIPLYLFLFAIYYGVSALAGIVWRNAIVSVVLAVVFWLVCWTLGTATQLVETLSLNPRRLVTIVPTGDTLIAVNQSDLFRWDDSDGNWEKILVARADAQLPFMFPSRLAGPIHDRSGDRILAFKTAMPGFSPFQAANRLLIGKRAEDWRRTEGVNVPDGAFALLMSPQGEVLIVSPQAIYRLEGDLEAKQQDINVFGLHIPLPEKGGRFADVGPKVRMRPLESVAIDPQTGTLALFDGFRLALFERTAKGAYRQTKDQSFERKQTGEVALGGGQVFLALADGQIRRYDSNLKTGEPVASPTPSVPGALVISPDARYLVALFRSARLVIYDLGERKPLPLPIAGQGEISAVAFDGRKLLVADRLTRVTRYDLDKLAIERQWTGRMPLAEKIYRYALHPLYTVFPKPSDLNQTVTYVLTAKDAPLSGVRFDNGNNNTPAKLDVWGPVWSNLAFLIVVLAIACGYIYRKDF
ncbi:MAG: ABC transporter permease [Planctomycetia bacterium]|nr:ABC transporter permease [Planctomycetia bacterium]